MMSQKETAKRAYDTAMRALGLLDLTDLNDVSSDAAVRALAAKGQTEFGNVAALCIWPQYVKCAKEAVQGTDISIATVVNFPSGGTDSEAVLAETLKALEDGAGEIDLVLPYQAFSAGDIETASEMVHLIAATCKNKALLKVILETGILEDASAIREAALLAIDCGADFIKTSTGKVKVNATLETAEIMLGVIAETNPKIGFKPAGGIRTVNDAAAYLALCDKVLGQEWAKKSTMRFGASGLLDDILATLSGTQNSATSGY